MANNLAFKSVQDLPDDLKSLCIEYFFQFSRFEYALKENGFVKSGRHGEALPAWEIFINKYNNRYIVSDEARNLIENPPQRQVIRNQYCEWEDTDFSRANSDLDKVILIIKAIRNNLFHGGKSSQKDWDNPDRNIFLINNSIEVLRKLALMADIYGDYIRSY